MEIYKTIVLAIAAYFIGSISFSYIITKKVTGQDIRNIKIKNAGAFNVFISVGSNFGIVVAVLDSFKTLIIILVARGWGFDHAHTIIAASFAIIGHCFPIYYNFYGGKGAATVIGILIYFIPVEFLICIIPAFLIAIVIHDKGTTPIFFILFSPFAAYISHKPPILVYSLIYIVLLTGVLNAIILLTKRDQKVF
jgi:glycerol-3-phosphate acyltransferase PlsY